MRQTIKKFWSKIRLGVIILLSISIGVTWTFSTERFLEIKKEADHTWQTVERINAERVQGEIPSAQPEVNEEGAPTEDNGTGEVTLSPPSGKIERLIYETFGQENFKVAVAVAKAESQLNPQAVGKNRNGTTDCGVFQINSIHKLENCTDPETNIRCAYEMFQKSGWTPWVAYKTGAYQKYLN